MAHMDTNRLERPRAATCGCARNLRAFANPRELVAKISSGLPAALWILRQAFLDDAIQQRRRQRLVRRHRRRIAVQDRRNQAGLARAFERPLAGDHLVDDRPEGENVRAAVGFLPLELFGSHVLNRAENGSLGRQMLVGR